VALDNFGSSFDKKESQGLKEDEMIPLLCQFLEDCLGCLLDETVEWDPEKILSLRTTLRDTFVAITDFLDDQKVFYFEIYPKTTCT
jgi:hypothetical protein